MRKIPKFLLGFLTGIALTLVIGVYICNYFLFPRPDSFYQSGTMPFYVDKDQSGYAVFELLNSREYWEEMSLAAEQEAENFLKKKGRKVDVNIHCVGRAQGYKFYYSYPRASSLRNWNSQDDVETVIRDFIHARFMNDVMKIYGKE
jgi:hypothetical protein